LASTFYNNQKDIGKQIEERKALRTTSASTDNQLYLSAKLQHKKLGLREAIFRYGQAKTNMKALLFCIFLLSFNNLLCLRLW
jgi:hypothetical protein